MSAAEQDRYADYRRISAEEGLMFQDFVVEVALSNGVTITPYCSRAYQWRYGESREGYEIKFDDGRRTTGNLYIEYAEKACPRPGDYAVGGIESVHHQHFVIGDYSVIYVFQSAFLRLMKDQPGEFRGFKYRHVTKDTSLGFLLPEADAVTMAEDVWRPGGDIWRPRKNGSAVR